MCNARLIFFINTRVSLQLRRYKYEVRRAYSMPIYNLVVVQRITVPLYKGFLTTKLQYPNSYPGESHWKQRAYTYCMLLLVAEILQYPRLVQ